MICNFFSVRTFYYLASDYFAFFNSFNRSFPHVSIAPMRPLVFIVAEPLIKILLKLVHPLRTGDETLAEKYRDILLSSEGLTTFEIFHEVSEMASRLRAKYSMRTPDAIQIAVGILYHATKFLTNDPNLKKVSDIKVLVLDDYLTK